MSNSTTKPAIDNLSKWTASCTSGETQRREHRNNWIAFIIIIVFSAVSLCVALLMIFIGQEGSIITHLKAEIHNVKFNRLMKNRTSKEFRSVSRPFCNEINKYFRSSQLSKMYQHCVVDRLRRGEKANTTVEFRIRFKNPKAFVNPYKVRDVILSNAGRLRRNNHFYLCIGRFLILYKSLRIFLVRTSSTVPDILVRSKGNGVNPDPNSDDYESDDYADDDPLTTWTEETNHSITSENYPSPRGTAEDERITSVTLGEMSTMSTHSPIPSPNILVASKGSSILNSTKRKGSNMSSNRTFNGTSTTVGHPRYANNPNFSNKTISPFNSSTQIKNSSVGGEHDDTCEHQSKSDSLRLLNTGGESTASSQLETPTFSPVHVNGGTGSKSMLILAGTTVAYLSSPLSTASLFMTKLTTAKSDNERTITTYNKESDKVRNITNYNRASDKGQNITNYNRASDKEQNITNYYKASDKEQNITNHNRAFNKEPNITNYNRASDKGQNITNYDRASDKGQNITNYYRASDKGQNITEYYRASVKDATNGLNDTLIVGNHKSDSENDTFVLFPRNVTDQNMTEIYNQTSDYDRSESVANGAERLHAETSHTKNEDVTSTGIWEQYDSSTTGELERLQHNAMFSQNGQQRVYDSQFNASFSNENVTWYRKLNKNGKTNDNEAVNTGYGSGEESKDGTERITEVPNDRIDSMNYDIQVHSPEISLNSEVNDTFLALDDKDILSRVNSTPVYDTNKEGLLNDLDEYNASSYFGINGYFVGSGYYPGINYHSDSLSNYYHGSNSNEGNNSSSSFIDSVYIQSPKQYNDGRRIGNTTKMEHNSSFYVGKSRNRTNSGSWSAAWILGHYNKTTVRSSKIEGIGNNSTGIESNDFRMEYDRLLSYEDAGDLNGTFSGAEVTRQFNLISNDSSYEEYHDTPDRIVGVGLYDNMSVGFENNDRNNDTVYGFAKTDNSMSSNEDLDRSLTTFTPTLTVYINSGISERSPQNRTSLIRENRTSTSSSTAGLKTNRTLYLWSNRSFFNFDNDNLTFPSREAPILRNKSDDSFDRLQVKAGSSISLFDHGGSLRSLNNRTDLRYVSKGTNQTQVASSTTLNPITNVADSEKTVHITTSRMTPTETTMPKKVGRLLVFTKRKSRVNIKPSGSGWLAIRVHQTSRYFARARTGKSGPSSSTPSTTTNNKVDIRLIAGEQGVDVTNPSTKNATRREGFTVTPLEGAMLRTNASRGVDIFTPGKIADASSDAKEIIPGVTHTPQLQRIQPMIKPSSLRLPLRIDPELLALNSRSISTVDNLTKSRQVLEEEDTQIEETVFRRENHSKHKQFYGGTDEAKDQGPEESLLKTTSSYKYNDSLSIENTMSMKYNSSFYTDRLGNETKVKYSLTANTLEHDDTPTNRSFITGSIGDNNISNDNGSDVFRKEYNDRLLSYEDTEHLNSTSAGTVSTRQFNRISNDSSHGQYFNNTQERVVDAHITDGSGEALTNIQEPFSAEYRQNFSRTESNVQLNSIPSTSSNIAMDSRFDVNNQFAIGGSADFGVNDNLENLDNDQLTYNSVNSTGYYETTNFLDSGIRSTASTILPTPVTVPVRTPSKNKTVMDSTSHEHIDSPVEVQKSIKLSELRPFVSVVRPTIRFEKSRSFGNSVLSPTTPMITTANSSLKNLIFSASPKDERKYTSTILTATETIQDTMNNTIENKIIDDVESSVGILSSIEDPLFESYNITHGKFDSNDSRQSRIKSSKSIYNKQLLFAVSVPDESQNVRQNKTIANVESNGDVLSSVEDLLFEAYDLASDRYDSKNSIQSRIETSTSIRNKQETSTVRLSDESPRFQNTTSRDNIYGRLSTTFKNLALNINDSTFMTNVSDGPKPNSRNKSSGPFPTKTGNQTITSMTNSRTTSPLLRLFFLEGKSHRNSSLKARTLAEAMLNRSSGISSKLSALGFAKKLLGNGTKDLVGVTVIIDIKSAGSGWVKVPVIKTSSSKGAEIGGRRTSTTSTTSKPFTNTSIVSTLLEPSLVPETTSISTNIARWEPITTAFNINPVAFENSDVLKHILIPTPASQTALTNATFGAAKGLHLGNGYFQSANAPAFKAPTSVTGTKKNGTSAEGENSTVRKDFTSIASTESTSELQTVRPAEKSSTLFIISTSESDSSANIQALSQAVTVSRVTSGHSTEPTTKTLATPTITTTKTPTIATFPTTTSPSITTTLPIPTTMPSLPLTTTTLPPTTTLATTMLLRTTRPPTATTLETTLSPKTTIALTTTALATTLPITTMQPATTTLATPLPLTTTTLPPTTTLTTTLPLTTTMPLTTTTLATTMPLATTPQSSTTTIFATTTLPITTTLLPPTTTLATTTVPTTTTSLTTNPTTITTLLLRLMTTIPATTNTKLTIISPLTTTTPTLSPPPSTTKKTATLSFLMTLPTTTEMTTLPTTIQQTTTSTQLTNPSPTTTIGQPPPTSTTAIASTTPTSTIPKTTSPQTTTLLSTSTATTQPLTTQTSTSSTTEPPTPPPVTTPSPLTISTTTITTTPPTTSLITSQTPTPVTSTAIQRLPVNTILISSSTPTSAQTTSNTVTFAPAAFSSSAGPTSTSPAPATTTTNPTTTEITVLNMTSVSGALYEPASVICTLIGPKTWTRIDLLLHQPKLNRSKILATFKRASLSSETEDKTHSASLTIRGQASRAKLIIERFQCDDQGLYVCRVDNGQLEEKTDVYAKILTPDLPKIEVNDFVEHQTTKVSCTGIVPFPNGDLDWKLNGRILRRTTMARVDAAAGNCTKLLTKTFVGRFGRRLHGSELTCFESGSPQRFTSIKVQIVPGNFCEGRPINKVYSHPYTCNKYITCLDGYFLTSHCPGSLCYNAERNRCEEVNKPTNPTSITGKDVFSCIGKPTGEAVPNPDECSGYYLCVAGLKNTRRCPSYTYFTLTITGFCTFDYSQSYCASIGKKLQTE